MSADPHRAAILALLDALPIDVHAETVPLGTSPPYIRPYISVEYPEAADSRALTTGSQRAVVRIMCHAVGRTGTAADIVAGAVRGVLLDVTPTVTGRLCFPIRMEQSLDPEPDESTGVLVMDQRTLYRLESVPA